MATLTAMPAAAAAPLLALDTSTETMSVALRGPLGARCYEGEGGAQASAALLPRVQAMLREQGLRAADLQAVAFGRGPGAFTGLRTACAVAQGLALGAGCPVVPVDSLMIVAEDTADACAADAQEGLGGAADPGQRWGVPAAGSLAAVAMDARMGEVYAALYRWYGPGAAAGWEVVQPPCLCAPQALAGAWPTLLDAAQAAHMAHMVHIAHMADPAHAADPAHTVRWAAGSAIAWLPAGAVPRGMPVRRGRSRAGALLRLAERLLAAGSAVDPAQALPLYLRDKVALTVAERAAAAAPPA